MVTGLWLTYIPNFGSLYWCWRCKEHLCPLSPHLGLWRTLDVSDWGLASWSWFGYGHCSFIHSCSKFWPSFLIFEVQRTSMSFKSCFGTLEDTGSFWLGFGILILIYIWSLDFDTPMLWIFALYLDFKVQRTSVSLKSLFRLWRMQDVLDWGSASWVVISI